MMPTLQTKGTKSQRMKQKFNEFNEDHEIGGVAKEVEDTQVRNIGMMNKIDL